MKEHALRPGFMAAAILAIAGILILLLPQYAISIGRLAIVTFAASAGLHAFATLAPPAWWKSPFDPDFQHVRRARSADEVDWIRSTLAARRQPVPGAPDLPPQTLRFLQPIINAALERHGLEPRELTPLARAVLDARPLDHAPWYRTRRPDGGAAAETVHAVLDELDRLERGIHHGPARAPGHPRTP